MGKKSTKIFHCKTHQKLPKLFFWFENKPSGNPGKKHSGRGESGWAGVGVEAN
jgi:hypothetical protein